MVRILEEFLPMYTPATRLASILELLQSREQLSAQPPWSSRVVRLHAPVATTAHGVDASVAELSEAEAKTLLCCIADLPWLARDRTRPQVPIAVRGPEALPTSLRGVPEDILARLKE